SLGLLAARLGWASGDVLVYGKAGAAWADATATLQATDSVISHSNSGTRWGWMLGAGVEYALGGNLSAFAEYNHIDFGTQTLGFTASGGPFTADLQQQVDSVRMGLNYRFGAADGRTAFAPAPPVPAAGWSAQVGARWFASTGRMQKDLYDPFQTPRLNSRLIWRSLDAVKRNDPKAVAFLNAIGLGGAPVTTKAEYYLIDLAGANVIFQHGLVNPTMQRHMNLRLAGSFYTVNLIGAPAYSVFVRDPGYSDVVVPIAMTSLQVTGETKRQPFFVVGSAVALDAPPQTVTLLFGIGQSLTGRTVEVKDAAGSTLGTCAVPPFADPKFAEGVASCAVEIPPSDTARKLTIVPADGGPMRFFEPSARITGQAAATAQ
ncbi:MAG: hypothetical protein B7X99_07020, partial [Rhizobiales bacterium 17-65-6]